MAKRNGFVITLKIDGVFETIAAIRKMGPEASKSLRTRTLELSKGLAVKVAAAAKGERRQAALVAPTVKARKDRLPVIQAGGGRRVGSNRVPVYKVLFGSEFGGTYLRQFKPHLGRGSYWFYKTVEDNQAEIVDAWRRVADDVVGEFRRG